MDVAGQIQRQTDVALSLASELISSEGKERNLVFSPLSIHVVLSMIVAGSKGPTREQLLGYLKSTSAEELQSLSSQLVNLIFVDGGPAGGPILSLANGLWVEQSMGLNSKFKQALETHYKAISSEVDFLTKAVEVTKTVNLWSEKKTNGLIKEILPPGSVDASTRLISANAVYFKGAWAQKFDPSLTKDHEFHLINGASIQVPFMTSNKKQYAASFDGFKVVGLPYKAGQDSRLFTMYIFLPDARDGLPSLVKKINSVSGFIEHHIPYREVALGKFLIPKFKISSGFEASDVLKKQGLLLPFSAKADLSEITGSPEGQLLYVSNVFHKAFIEVNEEGTEAAAVTAAVVTYRSLSFHEKLNFVADHPFLFAIRENKTGVLLVIGQVLNPLVSA